MAWMFSLRTIHLPKEGGGVKIVEKRKAFEVTPDQAKQLDALKSARPATLDEVKAAKAAAARADGSAAPAAAPVAQPAPAAAVDDTATKPPSGAAGDPDAPVKGKSD